MGIRCDLKKSFDLLYRAEFKNGLTEHEYDHIFIGEFSGIPEINPEEVMNWRYISEEELEMELAKHPDAFTPWFHLILEKLKSTDRQLIA